MNTTLKEDLILLNTIIKEIRRKLKHRESSKKYKKNKKENKDKKPNPLLNTILDDVSYLGNLCKNNHNYNNTGLSRRYNKCGKCSSCRDRKRKEWYSKNKPHLLQLSSKWAKLNRPHMNELNRNWRRNNIEKSKIHKENYKNKSYIRYQFINKRANSKQKHIEFTLTLDFLESLWEKQNGKCYWFGIPIFSNKTPSCHPLKSTLDRLDPTKGYTQDNVVWASHLANVGRANCNCDEFKQIIKNILQQK